MNYTKPNEPDHKDSPQDWLNTSLIFARTISLLLKEREGIVVDIKGDVVLEREAEKVVVFKKNNQIVIDYTDIDYEEGSLIMVIDENLN
jgi:hypothetical protein